MAGFRCPFCGQIASVDDSTIYKQSVYFSGHRRGLDSPYVTVEIFHCPNCDKEAISLRGMCGAMDGKFIHVYPESNAKQFPEYIPKAIRNDYEESHAILKKSPKASATLARRCLQGMIRDFWGIKKNRLIDEISELQGKVPASQWAAIDALRKLGNIGAHMEKDVNAIVDVDQDEAGSLLVLIELLMEKWYINRHDEEELYNMIVGASEEKKETKSTVNP